MKPEAKAAIERRRERIQELLVNGLNPYQIAKQCFAEGLVPSENLDAAYALIRKDLKKLAETWSTANAQASDAAKWLFIKRNEKIYLNALSKFHAAKTEDNKGLNEFARLGYLRLAMEANESIAAAQGVNIRPRFKVVADTESFDAADEAAREVIAAARTRQKLLESKKSDNPTGAEEAEVINEDTEESE